jgi:hypothetical protein
VRTPLLLATADLVKAPQLGIAWMNEPKMLHSPKVIISCVASTITPLANKTFSQMG